MDWNMFADTSPKGINKRKKHRILKASTIFGAKTALSVEYENMNDKGSANIKKNAHTITDDSIHRLIP